MIEAEPPGFALASCSVFEGMRHSSPRNGHNTYRACLVFGFQDHPQSCVHVRSNYFHHDEINEAPTTGVLRSLRVFEEFQFEVGNFGGVTHVGVSQGRAG